MRRLLIAIATLSALSLAPAVSADGNTEQPHPETRPCLDVIDMDFAYVRQVDEGLLPIPEDDEIAQHYLEVDVELATEPCAGAGYSVTFHAWQGDAYAAGERTTLVIDPADANGTELRARLDFDEFDCVRVDVMAETSIGGAGDIAPNGGLDGAQDAGCDGGGSSVGYY